MAQVFRLAELDDERLDAFARLTDRQLRGALEAERGILVAESRLVVEVALEAGVVPLAFLANERQLAACADLLGRAGDEVPVYVLPDEEMARLTGYQVTRGLLCAMRRPPERPFDEVVAGARRVAALEDLVDVTNVGALFRSAAALGADAVVLSPGCADPLNRRSVRVSMGTVFQVPWARAEKGTWPDKTFSDLRGRGFSCWAMALGPDAVPIDDPTLELGEKRALLFGSEGPGLSERALAACDRRLVIPMANGVDSLNVAASSAVAFWHLFRH